MPIFRTHDDTVCRSELRLQLILLGVGNDLPIAPPSRISEIRWYAQKSIPFVEQNLTQSLYEDCGWRFHILPSDKNTKKGVKGHVIPVASVEARASNGCKMSCTTYVPEPPRFPFPLIVKEHPLVLLFGQRCTSG